MSLIEQLRFVRRNTIDYANKVNEELLEIVPQGLNNHIKWNLGHIYVVTEKFCFHLTGEKVNVPGNYQELFSPGTSPKDWAKISPQKEELLTLLNEQIVRIEESRVVDRVGQPLKEVFKTSTGLQITNVGECLSFCLYHEGMHFGAIKAINQYLQK